MPASTAQRGMRFDQEEKMPPRRSKHSFAVAISAAAGLLIATSAALAQEKTFELKLSHWVPPTHPLEKAVAEAVTFPWGSVPLLGVDKVTKYHMDAPLHTVTFQWLMSPRTYAAMSAAQKKVIDDHCTTEWAGKFADPWAEFERAGLAKVKAEPGHEVYTITDAQLDEWKKSAEPLEEQWFDNVRKAGRDPDTIMKELKQSLAQYKAAY